MDRRKQIQRIHTLLDDLYGLLYVEGNDNTITANHISEVMNQEYIKPCGEVPVVIHVVSGKGNYISGNHIVANAEAPEAAEAKYGSCFSMQVDALLSVRELEPLPVVTVLVEEGAAQPLLLVIAIMGTALGNFNLPIGDTVNKPVCAINPAALPSRELTL